MNEKKVREAIYCMKSFADDTVCEECDNYDRCDHTMVADNARTAIEALEKQLPKKPIEYEDKYYACPICGNVLMHKYEKYPTILADRKNGLPCCLSCLQVIDSDLVDSTVTGCRIYCEPENAKSDVEDYIKNRM